MYRFHNGSIYILIKEGGAGNSYLCMCPSHRSFRGVWGKGLYVFLIDPKPFLFYSIPPRKSTPTEKFQDLYYYVLDKFINFTKFLYDCRTIKVITYKEGLFRSQRVSSTHVLTKTIIIKYH